MIKVETLGMLDVAKNNPVLKSAKEIKNYTFLVDDGDAYVVMQTNAGDDAYREDVVTLIGKPLNGFQLEAWKGQNLIIDAKHIAGVFATVSVKNTVLVIDEATGKLKVGTANGVHFVVKGATRLTEDAVIAKVVIAPTV
jgi:arginine repressor